MLATHSQSSLGFIFRIRMTLSGTIFRDKIFPLGCFVRNRCRALISSGSTTMNWRRQPLSSSQNCHPPELSIQWSYQLVYAYNVRWMLRNFDNFTGQCIPSTHYGHALDHNLHHCGFWPKYIIVVRCSPLCRRKCANGHAAYRAKLAGHGMIKTYLEWRTSQCHCGEVKYWAMISIGWSLISRCLIRVKL